MKKGFLTYSLSSAFFDMAINLMKTFGIVFFFIKSGNNIFIAMGAYALATSIELVCLYILRNVIGKIGTRYALLLSRLSFFATAIPVLLLDENNYLHALLLWSFLYGLAKSLFFIPLHYMLINLTKDIQKGKAIGSLYAISSLIGILSPFLAGFVSATYGNAGYALIIGAAFLISSILMLKVPNLKFSYTSDVKNALDLKNIKRELRYSIMFQLQSQEGYWQVHIFKLLQNNFLQLGFITTAINLIGAMLNLILGHWLDRHDRFQTLKITSFMQGSGWLMRLLVNSPLGVLISDSYMRLTSQALGETLTVFTYDLLSVRGKEIILDEKIVAREIVLSATWVVVTVCSMGLVYFFGFEATFILAILGSLAIVVL